MRSPSSLEAVSFARILGRVDSFPVTTAKGFRPTRWSMIAAAGHWRTGSAGRLAMDELARAYYFPLYAYIRRRGHGPSESEDLVQGFLTHLLEHDSLLSANPNRGKFRSFLLASLKNYLANQWDRSNAKKRRDSRPAISFDALSAEARYAAEPADTMTPDRLFDRRWALQVLQVVLSRLRSEYTTRERSDLFSALEPALASGEKARYASLATQLNMTESAIKVAAHRLRCRYREILRDEIAQTVSDPALVDEEIRELMNSL